MKILIGCEFTQILTRALRERGHEAYSCDIAETEGNPCWHIQDDLLKVIKHRAWDMMVAFPPCTYLCNSGVRWLHTVKGRWVDMERAAIFFKTLLNTGIPKVAIENPIMHRYAIKIIGAKQDQIIQPYMFGHGETKATCLWLRGLPCLVRTKVVAGREQRILKMPPSRDRSRDRSRTYVGIAEAMAIQWTGAETVVQERLAI